jgi:acetylornithine deacetylase/succinyl-diaminopimelate desuccinylase-like protein
VSTAFNDNHWFRERGIAAYGFSTMAARPDEASAGTHGNDERISLDTWKRALPLYYQVLSRFCGPSSPATSAPAK